VQVAWGEFPGSPPRQAGRGRVRAEVVVVVPAGGVAGVRRQAGWRERQWQQLGRVVKRRERGGQWGACSAGRAGAGGV